MGRPTLGLLSRLKGFTDEEPGPVIGRRTRWGDETNILDERLLRVAGAEFCFHGALLGVAEAAHGDEDGGAGRWVPVVVAGQRGVQVAGVSACRLDMRICELLLLRMDSCVPPFTPLLASEGCRCFRSTAKYRFTVQLRHFLLISDCTFRDILHKVIINGPRWKETTSLSFSYMLLPN